MKKPFTSSGVLWSVLAPLVALSVSSCGLSGKAYVDESVGFAVTRGQVIRVDGLNTERQEHLTDGVAVRVVDPGCRVSVKMGSPVQLIELRPGSILVLGDQDDWIMQPYGEQPQSAQPGQQTPQARPAEDMGPRFEPAPGGPVINTKQ